MLFRLATAQTTLQTMIDKAYATGRTLYVIAADLSNAFPSTDRATLWLKMRRLGVSGKLFNWLCLLYGRMRYLVCHAGSESQLFESLIGILIGDTLSPNAWNLYLSNFNPPMGSDDVVLVNSLVPHMEQADDIILASFSPQRTQGLLNSLVDWDKYNFILTNVFKTEAIHFGKSPRTMPIFTIHGIEVKTTKILKCVGIHLVNSPSNIMREHYTQKAIRAKSTAHAVLHVESMVQGLPPWQGKILYMGRIDPHLTHARKCSPDAVLSSLLKLEAV